jgi:hypothetical protein
MSEKVNLGESPNQNRTCIIGMSARKNCTFALQLDMQLPVLVRELLMLQKEIMV